MKREVAKVTGGKRDDERTLPSVFSLYHLFDNVVSASEDLNRITARDLGRFAKADTFTYASNIVDFAGIQEKAYGLRALGAADVVEPSDGSVDFGHGVGGSSPGSPMCTGGRRSRRRSHVTSSGTSTCRAPRAWSTSCPSDGCPRRRTTSA